MVMKRLGGKKKKGHRKEKHKLQSKGGSGQGHEMNQVRGSPKKRRSLDKGTDAGERKPSRKRAVVVKIVFKTQGLAKKAGGFCHKGGETVTEPRHTKKQGRGEIRGPVSPDSPGGEQKDGWPKGMRCEKKRTAWDKKGDWATQAPKRQQTFGMGNG